MYKGTNTEAVILKIIGTNPYHKSTMRIRYTTGGSFAFYWRNVIIDLVNGWYYVIDPASATGTTPVTTPMTYVNGTAVAAPSGAAVQNADIRTNTVVIAAAPAGSVPSTNDQDSQNAFRMQDAASQDAISVEYQATSWSGSNSLALLASLVSMVVLVLIL